MEVDELILQAIIEGARAGVFRAAARLNPKSRRTWDSFGELHHEKATALLAQAVKRLGNARESPGSGAKPYYNR